MKIHFLSHGFYVCLLALVVCACDSGASTVDGGSGKGGSAAGGAAGTDSGGAGGGAGGRAGSAGTDGAGAGGTSGRGGSSAGGTSGRCGRWNRRARWFVRWRWCRRAGRRHRVRTDHLRSRAVDLRLQLRRRRDARWLALQLPRHSCRLWQPAHLRLLVRGDVPAHRHLRSLHVYRSVDGLDLHPWLTLANAIPFKERALRERGSRLGPCRPAGARRRRTSRGPSRRRSAGRARSCRAPRRPRDVRAR